MRHVRKAFHPDQRAQGARTKPVCCFQFSQNLRSTHGNLIKPSSARVRSLSSASTVQNAFRIRVRLSVTAVCTPASVLTIAPSRNGALHLGLCTTCLNTAVLISLLHQSLCFLPKELFTTSRMARAQHALACRRSSTNYAWKDPQELCSTQYRLSCGSDIKTPYDWTKADLDASDGHR